MGVTRISRSISRRRPSSANFVIDHAYLLFVRVPVNLKIVPTHGVLRVVLNTWGAPWYTLLSTTLNTPCVGTILRFMTSEPYWQSSLSSKTTETGQNQLQFSTTPLHPCAPLHPLKHFLIMQLIVDETALKHTVYATLALVLKFQATNMVSLYTRS